jgi:uncharacterized phage-associated protein
MGAKPPSRKLEQKLRCASILQSQRQRGVIMPIATPAPKSTPLFVSRNREKLLNAIIYFLRETNHCHTLKLFKLLNFADFEHFRQTGRTITGLDYRAYPMGPVPTKLFDEIKRGGDKDLREAITLIAVKDDISNELLRRDLRARGEFDKKWFTPRELRVLARIAELFRDLPAADMTKFSHENKRPWATVYKSGEGDGRLIRPELVFKAAPLMKELPDIDQDELQYRKGLLRDLA